MAAETTPPPEGGPNPRCRRNLAAGMTVDIVLKQDQRSGRTVRGTVRDLLTRSARHPHGIKVRLTDGRVGRVRRIISP